LVELARPRLVTLGLAVVGLTYVIAPGKPVAQELWWLLIGSGLALCGASAANQVLERDTDALMRRTSSRPLPAGRIQPGVAVAYGALLTVTGVVVLWSVFGALCALVTLAGWLLYVAVYTPLKRRSSLAVYVGAVPGAAPVLIGWSAATGTLDFAAACLFAILAVWQLPHFMAIGWMYRSDYRRAGLQVVPTGPGAGRKVATSALVYAAVLVPLVLVPLALGVTSAWWYAAGAVAACTYQLAAGIRFRRTCTGATARGLLRASVLALPAVLTLLALGANPGS
jgi:protoheme IX farnesyltransferase